MIDGDENFLSRKKNEEGKLGLRRETNTGYKARLVFSLVHGHTVNHTAVSLRKYLFISNQKGEREFTLKAVVILIIETLDHVIGATLMLSSEMLREPGSWQMITRGEGIGSL